MRTVVFLVVLIGSCSRAAEPSEKQSPAPADIDKQLVDALKDLHNRGADLFNDGEPRGAYRLFQGTLLTTRAMLTHRPAEQKFIDDALAAVERLPTADERAFALHKTIQNLRNRLKPPPVVKDGIVPELLLPPREHKDKPKIEPPKDGVMGRLMWQGQPLDDVTVQFVSRGEKALVRDAKTDSNGLYVLPNVPPGQYTVVLSASASQKTTLPERYAASNTSPLIVDVKGDGDTLDFLLQ